MAIINPSRKFEGGEMNKNPYGQTLKSGVRVVSFRDPENQKGVFLFILPPYKVDATGAGVWYKVYKVRDNFGLDIKEKFVVQPNCPIDWFAAKVKLYAPDYGKTLSQKKDGKDVKVYPSFGRISTRVLFNTAFFKNLGAGAHVLDVPQFGCADKIDQHVNGKDPFGADNPMLNDWKAALPVEFKLKIGGIGNPWEVNVHGAKPYELPEQLADSDNLYNLDEVVLYPEKDELIEKLRRITPGEIFEKCMAGYSDGSVKVSLAAAPSVAPTPTPTRSTRPAPTPAAEAPTNTEEDNIPMGEPTPVSVAPTFSVPRASIPSAAVAEVPRVSTPVSGNPIGGLSVDQMKEFLKKK